MGMLVRRASAVKLVDDLAGESSASANCPVGTVVISGDGAGDQTVGSPEVNALDGWTQVWSAPTGGLAKQQVVARANRSQASKTHTSPEWLQYRPFKKDSGLVPPFAQVDCRFLK